MRLIKMIGLAGMAALAAMAVIGASSASAKYDTALCKVDPAPALACPSGELKSAVHYLDPAARLLNSLKEIVCHALFEGSVEGPLLATAPAPLVIVGNLSYTNCTTGCEAKEVSSAAEVLVLKTGPELASIIGEGEVLYRCVNLGVLGLHCVYNGEGIEGEGEGGLYLRPEDGTLRAHVRLLTPLRKTMGLLCPDSASLDVLFVSLDHEYLTS